MAPIMAPAWPFMALSTSNGSAGEIFLAAPVKSSFPRRSHGQTAGLSPNSTDEASNERSGGHLDPFVGQLGGAMGDEPVEHRAIVGLERGQRRGALCS